MKRIIDGVAYNTATATKIAQTQYEPSPQWGGPQGESVLYQTRGGAFFVHTHEVLTYQDRKGEWQDRETNEVTAMTREEAHAWVMEGDVELLSDVFGEPPEASGEAVTSEATIYTRLHTSLKERVEACAEADGISVNAYVIRSLEMSCATTRA